MQPLKGASGKACAVLLIAGDPATVPQHRALESIGFRVERASALCCDEALLTYEAVIVVLPRVEDVGRVAARVRAQRHFGSRVLIALVPDAVSETERRRAAASGMDAVLPNSVPARVLAAQILARLRDQPEHRCRLRPGRPTKAA